NGFDDADRAAFNAHYGTVLPAPPSAPNTLTATAALGEGRIDMNWTAPQAVPPPDGYHISRSDDGGVTWRLWDEVIGPTQTHWYEIRLPEGAKYDYRVRAFIWENGDSPTTNKVWSVTNLPAPSDLSTSLLGPIC